MHGSGVCEREREEERDQASRGCVRTAVTARHTDFEHVALLRCDGLGEEELVGDGPSLPRVALGGQAVLVRHALAGVVEGAPCRGDADEGFEGSRDIVARSEDQLGVEVVVHGCGGGEYDGLRYPAPVRPVVSRRRFAPSLAAGLPGERH